MAGVGRAMRRLAFITVLAAGMVCASAVFAGGPYGTINVDDWHGGAYTKGNTTEFTHCAAVTTDGGGTALLLGQSVEGIWVVGFSGTSWSLKKGETLPIQAAFDGQKPFNLVATAINTKSVSAALSNAALAQLIKARQLTVSGKSQTLQFALSSTEKIVAVVANCVARVKQAGIAKAGDFSNPQQKPAVAAATAPSSTSPSSTSPPSKLAPVSGTGFVISTKGHIVTNNHVIRDCVGEVHGNLAGEATVNLRIVSADGINDLALLEATKRAAPTRIRR